MGNFKESFDITSKSEGGYADNPSDAGGMTFGGVSRKNWPNWTGWQLIDAYKAEHGTAGINRLLTTPQMEFDLQQFYEENFWNPLKLDQINDQQICNSAYDYAVTSGIDKSVRTLQQACGADVDGIIGPKTIELVNSKNPSVIMHFFNDGRELFYRQLARKPNQKRFLHSWLSRIKPYLEVG